MVEIWTGPLVNLSVLHCKWQSLEVTEHIHVHGPLLQAFQRSLMSLRSHAEDRLESAARIAHPFPVQTHVEGKHYLGFREIESNTLDIGLQV